jgi:hypothetical protein
MFDKRCLRGGSESRKATKLGATSAPWDEFWLVHRNALLINLAFIALADVVEDLPPSQVFRQPLWPLPGCMLEQLVECDPLLAAFLPVRPDTVVLVLQRGMQ